ASLLRGVDFWDLGHLLWRPLGYVAFVLTAPLTRLSTGAAPNLQAVLALLGLNWLAGLACTLLLHGLIVRFVAHAANALWATGAFVCTQGVLLYAQTGCAYIPGLAFLLLGLYVLARHDERLRRALPASAA